VTIVQGINTLIACQIVTVSLLSIVAVLLALGLAKGSK
jgi:hypothetical protein